MAASFLKAQLSQEGEGEGEVEVVLVTYDRANAEKAMAEGLKVGAGGGVW